MDGSNIPRMFTVGFGGGSGVFLPLGRVGGGSAGMRRNVTVTLAVLFAVSAVAACEPPGSKGTTKSHDSSAVTATPTESGVTTVPVEAFTPPGGDYSIVFPTKPKDFEQTVTLGDGTKTPVTMYMADSNGFQFMTAAITAPTGLLVSLESARDGMLASTKATLISSEPITLQARAGLKFAGNVENGQATFVSRIFSGDSTLYEVLAILPGGAALDDPQISAFFDSFKFTTEL